MGPCLCDLLLEGGVVVGLPMFCVANNLAFDELVCQLAGSA
jgi:hypothetical protein